MRDREKWVRALLAERAGYERRGGEDMEKRIAAVDEQLRLYGYEPVEVPRLRKAPAVKKQQAVESERLTA